MINYNEEKEMWKDVSGYEGLYQVSSFGNVRSLDREIIMNGGKITRRKGKMKKTSITRGYPIIGLSKDGKAKKYLVSRLVAIHFIENAENKPEVNHVDENKENNHFSNLEWVTAKENANHGTRNKRISEYVKMNPHKRGYKSVLQINPDTNEVVAEFGSVKEALVAVSAGPKAGGLSNCLTGNGKNKTFKGYKWEYKH